jgi:hypothetical protein
MKKKKDEGGRMKAEGKRPGRTPDKAAKMWKIMRGLNTFTIVDMVTLAGTTTRYAQVYVSVLKRCGYLREDGHASRNAVIYRLIKNSGPKSPAIISGLLDMNTGETFYVD